MALKTFRPLTPSLRYTATSDFAELTKSTPEKSLTYTRKRTGGRNNNGRMTSRHRGGGHKRKIRIIDWRRRRTDPAKVIGIEYDPNRSANLALLEYVSDKHRAYIIAPKGLTAGATVCSGADAEPTVGNCLPLHAVPLGMEVHNLELTPGRGGQIVRSAGGFATMMGLNKEYAQVKLPSGEIRMLHRNCTACIGQVGNVQHENIVLGKAGRSRWLGRRPHVRGMAMNPVDHPNGGGEGRSKSGGGRRHPVSPWGQLAKGLKTRTKHKPSNRFIVERRKKK